MRLVFHGQLRKILGEGVTMNSPSIADAIEGASRQMPNWPADMLLSVSGHYTDASLHEYVDEVHIMPAMAGGGGKWFKIVLGAAMIAVGIALGGFSNPLGAAFIINGALIMLQGVLAFFMHAPKNKNDNPDASKYMAVNKNTTAVDTPITMAWGRIDLAGHWQSLQSDSNNLSYGSFPANPT